MSRHRRTPSEPASEDARVSLHPLTFDQALEALLDAHSEDEGVVDDGDEPEGP
jgi:hypothetical protein